MRDREGNKCGVEGGRGKGERRETREVRRIQEAFESVSSNCSRGHLVRWR
jgi:hypothetical protein